MSLLPWWELDWTDIEDEDDPPIPELLTVAAGIGWWTADAGLFDHDDD